MHFPAVFRKKILIYNVVGVQTCGALQKHMQMIYLTHAFNPDPENCPLMGVLFCFPRVRLFLLRMCRGIIRHGHV